MSFEVQKSLSLYSLQRKGKGKTCKISQRRLKCFLRPQREMSARKKDNCKHLLDHYIGPVGWKLSEDANKHYSPIGLKEIKLWKERKLMLSLQCLCILVFKTLPHSQGNLPSFYLQNNNPVRKDELTEWLAQSHPDVFPWQTWIFYGLNLELPKSSPTF